MDRTAEQRQAADRAVQSKWYIPIPPLFVDSVGDPWRVVNIAHTLLEVLIFTIRKCPVKTGDDADRTLSLLNLFRSIDTTEQPYIPIDRGDFDWMIAHFKEYAHIVWQAPDSAFLRRWLIDNKKAKPTTATGAVSTNGVVN
jgi:hypothetical protein